MGWLIAAAASLLATPLIGRIATGDLWLFALKPAPQALTVQFVNRS
jgi:hypothetical protein